MSIESLLERIATALETLAEGKVEEKPVPKKKEAKVKAEAPAAVPPPVTAPAAVPEAPAAVPPPVESAPVPPPTAVPEAPAAPAMSATELNSKLVAEVQRLGSRDPIDAIFRDTFGIQSLKELDPSQYQNLLDEVMKVKA